MAVTFTRIGSELPATGVIAGGQIDPDVALLTDDRFDVASRHNVSGADTDIRVQFLNPDGTCSGSSAAIDQDSGRQIDPVVARPLSKQKPYRSRSSRFGRRGQGGVVSWQ